MNERFNFRVAIRQEDGSYRVCEVATIAWRSDKTIVGYDYVADAKHGKIGTIVIDGENAILEQCTGLTDKNGKLVYEGDVFEATVLNSFDGDEMTGKRIRGQVAYYVNEAAFTFAAYSPFNLSELEIIGNIHEIKNKDNSILANAPDTNIGRMEASNDKQ